MGSANHKTPLKTNMPRPPDVQTVCCEAIQVFLLPETSFKEVLSLFQHHISHIYLQTVARENAPTRRFALFADNLIALRYRC